jgi:outer membrane receptor protein involved in Fe transport
MPLDNAATVDLRILYEVGPLRASVDLLNLTDAQYEELGFVLPDFQGMSVPYVIPAAGREIRAGFQWRFDRSGR